MMGNGFKKCEVCGSLYPDGEAHECAVAAVEGSAEQLLVRAWRFDRFSELGFPFAVSELLAESPVDWHLAQRLIRRGCDVDTALKILA